MVKPWIPSFFSFQQFGDHQPPDDFNGTALHSSPQCTVQVVGLPDCVTEDLVINYFENRKKSKGGPVSRVVISPDLQTCKVTFESPDGRF